ncbi:MAG: hypothetical protein GF313_10440 [Caldithrix sp.]|nr:hypothetical protein [Caldithrix sp.]
MSEDLTPCIKEVVNLFTGFSSNPIKICDEWFVLVYVQQSIIEVSPEKQSQCRTCGFELTSFNGNDVMHSGVAGIDLC